MQCLTNTVQRPHSEYEKAASEWETVHDEDDIEYKSTYTRGAVRPTKMFEIVLGNRPRLSRPGLNRRNTILGPPDISLPQLPDRGLRKEIGRQYSFASSSSIYSDCDQGWIEEEVLLRLGLDIPMHLSSRTRPSTGVFERLRCGELVPNCSKTSSSASIDRFKYDAGVYSTFLHPTVERRVSHGPYRHEPSRDSQDILSEPLAPERPLVLGDSGRQYASFYNAAALRSA